MIEVLCSSLPLDLSHCNPEEIYPLISIARFTTHDHSFFSNGTLSRVYLVHTRGTINQG